MPTKYKYNQYNLFCAPCNNPTDFRVSYHALVTDSLYFEVPIEDGLNDEPPQREMEDVDNRDDEVFYCVVCGEEVVPNYEFETEVGEREGIIQMGTQPLNL